MIEVSFGLAISAFIAGFLMFVAPCTLPLVPAYLAFIAGVNRDDVTDPHRQRQVRRQLMINGSAFVLGFSLVFVLFGVAAGALGSSIGQFRELLSQIGGALIIFFGLFMLGVFNISPLQREHKLTIPSTLKPGHPVSALMIGSIFALGWTPCVGPVLATVILLATDSATAVSGGVLLSIFSLGLAVPFLLTAFAYGRAEQVIARYGSLSKFVNIIGGVFLILIGVLLLTSNFEMLLVYGYKVFQFMNWEGFYDYL